MLLIAFRFFEVVMWNISCLVAWLGRLSAFPWALGCLGMGIAVLGIPHQCSFKCNIAMLMFRINAQS